MNTQHGEEIVPRIRRIMKIGKEAEVCTSRMKNGGKRHVDNKRCNSVLKKEKFSPVKILPVQFSAI